MGCHIAEETGPGILKLIVFSVLSVPLGTSLSPFQHQFPHLSMKYLEFTPNFNILYL